MEVKPGYKQTELGVIAEDWEVKSLGELAGITAGGTPSRTNPRFWNGDIPWVTTSEVDYRTINETEQCITKEGLCNSAAKLLRRGTLLIALYGQGKTRGKVGILGIDAATNQACAAILLKHGVSSEFAFYLLAGQYDRIRNLSNTGNQENLNLSLIRSISILLPPELEQRAIATALSDVDALLGGLDRLIAKKRDLKQAAMQQLLTGQTRLPGFHGEWEVKTIDQVAFVTSGKRLPLGSSLVNVPTPHPYIRVTDMRPGTVDISELMYVPESVFPSIKQYRIYQADIFISVAGSLGIVGKVPAELNGANLTENADRITDIRCSQDYLLYVLLSPLIQNAIDSIRTVGAQPKLALARIRKFAIPLPPSIAEQTAIAAVLADMDAELIALEARRDKTRALKQAVMQELLTGRTRLISHDATCTEVKA